MTPRIDVRGRLASDPHTAATGDGVPMAGAPMAGAPRLRIVSRDASSFASHFITSTSQKCATAAARMIVAPPMSVCNALPASLLYDQSRLFRRASTA